MFIWRKSKLLGSLDSLFCSGKCATTCPSFPWYKLMNKSFEKVALEINTGASSSKLDKIMVPLCNEAPGSSSVQESTPSLLWFLCLASGWGFHYTHIQSFFLHFKLADKNPFIALRNWQYVVGNEFPKEDSAGGSFLVFLHLNRQNIMEETGWPRKFSRYTRLFERLF